MKPERWQRIEELYHSATTLPGHERVPFLARACGQDQGLLDEVQSLLDQGVTAEGWLDLPAVAMLAKAIAPAARRTAVSSERPTDVHQLIGKTMGHYHILEELGAGGMGAVYRAHDHRLRRDVALKVLTVDVASHAEQRARILSEARAASALNHPAITTIYEVGEDGEQLFIVMELVQGKSLRDLLCAGPVDTHVVVRLALQISEALAAAHAQGVVHGDIKPENVMVLTNNRVKLLDFGLASQAVEETLTVTHVNINLPVAGTLAYMAPEKLAGGSADTRSDLFSLGVLLYELVAGKRPFPGPSAMALATQVMNDVPAELQGEGGIISAELSRITFKLLQKKPASRYQSAHEVQVELNNVSRRLELGITVPAAVANKLAVAVLPFKLLTPNPDDEYLMVALADAVINRLSASGDLLVRPMSAVMRYTKQTMDLMLTGRELDVGVLVDGSIQKFGQRLRVGVQAWNVSDGSCRLSTKYDAAVSEIFELQDRIADGLAREFNPTAPPQMAGSSPTKNPAAYEVFLRGLERMRRNNRWDVRIAIEMFENATVIDPHFADAWAGLAEACVLMGGLFEPGPKWIARAEKAVRKALTLDRNNVEAYVARGRLIWTPAKNFQHRAALRALEQALQRRPTHDQALSWQGLVLMHIGLQSQAKECLTTALAVCPDNTFTLTMLGTTALYEGQYDEAWDWHSRALSIDRASLWANLLSPAAPLYAGQLEKAADAIRSAAQVLPKDPLLSSYEALLCAKRGERRKAEQLIQKATHGGGSLLHTHHMMHTVAAAYGVLGKPQPALAWLRKASANGLPIYPVYRDDPHFESIRSQPHFVRFMANLKKEWTSYQRDFGSTFREH
jgi:serine/threonine protein kinase/tetratricopeptide (TPR) repeat protein